MPADPRGPVRWKGWHSALLLAGFCLASFLPGIGARDLWNPDEPRYAQVAREMLRDDSLFVPRLNDQIYTQKPPLHFWTIAAFGTLRGGVDEVSARLPALAAVAVCGLLVMFLARLWFGPLAGWVAAASFLGCNSIQWRGRIGQIDMTLTALVLSAVTCWIVGRHRGDERWTLGFYAFSGLAILAKGPAGFLPPLVAIASFLALLGSWTDVRRFLRPRGFLLTAAICAIWLVPAYFIAGPSYWRALFLEQTLERYLEPSGHIQPFAYLWVIAPTDLLPFSLLLPAAIAALIASRSFRRIEPAGAGFPPGEALSFMVWWAFVTVLFFSLSEGKRSVYVMAVMAPLSILVAVGAQVLDRRRRAAAESGSPRAWAFSRVAAVVGAASIPLVFFGLALLLPAMVEREPELRRLGDPAIAAAQGLLWVTAVLSSIAAWIGMRRSWQGMLLVLGSTFGIFGAVAAVAVLPSMDTLKSARELSETVRREVPADERICIYPNPDAAFLFYSGRLLEKTDTLQKVRACLREREQPQWFLVERDDLPKLEIDIEMIEVARDSDWRQGHLLMRTRSPAADDPRGGRPPVSSE